MFQINYIAFHVITNVIDIIELSIKEFRIIKIQILVIFINIQILLSIVINEEDFMEVDVTHISKNGQVVIPVKIRKAANIKPNNEFYVYNVGEKILLEPINKENIKRELGLLELIKDAEKQIEKGESITFESSTSLEEMDKKLMEKVYED